MVPVRFPHGYLKSESFERAQNFVFPGTKKKSRKRRRDPGFTYGTPDFQKGEDRSPRALVLHSLEAGALWTPWP